MPILYLPGSALQFGTRLPNLELAIKSHSKSQLDSFISKHFSLVGNTTAWFPAGFSHSGRMYWHRNGTAAVVHVGRAYSVRIIIIVFFLLIVYWYICIIKLVMVMIWLSCVFVFTKNQINFTVQKSNFTCLKTHAVYKLLSKNFLNWHTRLCDWWQLKVSYKSDSPQQLNAILFTQPHELSPICYAFYMCCFACNHSLLISVMK